MIFWAIIAVIIIIVLVITIPYAVFVLSKMQMLGWLRTMERLQQRQKEAQENGARETKK